MERNPLDALNPDLEDAFRGLMAAEPRGTVETFGDITAVSTGVPLPYFNRVFVFERPASGDLKQAIEWMQTQPDPFFVTVTDRALTGADPLSDRWVLEPAGNPEPGMVLPSLDGIPGDDAAEDRQWPGDERPHEQTTSTSSSDR